MIELLHKTVPTDAKIKTQCENAWTAMFEKKQSGFYDLTSRSALWESTQERVNYTKGKLKLGVLGIGGSSLGAKAMLQAQVFTPREVKFFENIDDLYFWTRIPKPRDLENWHWAIVSKSGSTLETLSQASLLLEYYKTHKVDFAPNCTIITEPRSNPLYDFARAQNITMLEVPIDVGGRFSVLSPVGLFPTGFSGYDLKFVRQGAEWALKQKDLVADLAAQSLQSWSREEWITLLWCYSDRLLGAGYWFQQLWAESLGKEKTLDGKPAPRASTPMPALGANDQHSILQQVMDGPRDKMVWYLRARDAERGEKQIQDTPFSNLKFMNGKPLGELMKAEADATRMVTADKNISSLTLMLDRTGPEQIAAFFMLSQLVVACLGEVMGISTFDQPGVEAGKIRTKKLLE